jgi:uroporphyrinogen decarboxylase
VENRFDSKRRSTLQPKEIFALAMAKQEVPRVPFIETSVAFKLSEALLGRKLKPVEIPQLGLKARNVDDEKELSRLLGRDEISFRFTAPTFCEKLVGAGGQVFTGQGYIKDMDAFKKLFRLPDPDDDDLYEPIKTYIDKKEEFPIVLSTRLGFLSAYMSIGFETLMLSMYDNPELVDAVMSAYVDWSAKVIRRVIDMGVDCIKTTDDFAFNTGPFMSPAMFRQWVIPYHERAYKEINVPWILHTDGKVDVLLDDIFDMGFNALHPIDPNCYDIREFKRTHGHQTVIIGNVNLNNLGMGTPASVAEETRGLIRDLGPGYGWCISASNSVPDYVKPENLLAMTETIRKYGRYPISAV